MAAGLGSRFGSLTDKIPKGFIPYKEEPMIVRSIKTLVDCGIEKIIIGTGYKAEKYEDLTIHFPQIECVFSPKYAETNSMYTLYHCRSSIKSEDFILLESDLVFEKKAITALLDCKFENVMLVSPITKFQDQYYIEMNKQHILTNCSTDKKQINPCGELVGIHKLSNSFYKTMCQEFENNLITCLKLGYEYQILKMSQKIMPVHILKIDDLQWYEIDDIKDLQYAEKFINII